MKLIRFEYENEIYYGYIDNDKVVQTDKNYHKLNKPKIFDLENVQLKAPVKPGKIIAVGLNYMDHIKEMGHDIPTTPVVFNKFPQTVIGPNENIVLPDDDEKVDYEAELCVVIKKKIYKVTKDEAKKAILGAACLNDVTQRAQQKKDGQWTRGKNNETFCPIGPWIETDVDYNNTDIKLLLNGEVKQSSNTSNFLWTVEELIEFISSFTVLYPGDVVTTGTTSGVGKLHKGDVVEIEIDGIGKLTNYVIK